MNLRISETALINTITSPDTQMDDKKPFCSTELELKSDIHSFCSWDWVTFFPLQLILLVKIQVAKSTEIEKKKTQQNQKRTYNTIILFPLPIYTFNHVILRFMNHLLLGIWHTHFAISVIQCCVLHSHLHTRYVCCSELERLSGGGCQQSWYLLGIQQEQVCPFPVSNICLFFLRIHCCSTRIWSKTQLQENLQGKWHDIFHQLKKFKAKIKPKKTNL